MAQFKLLGSFVDFYFRLYSSILRFLDYLLSLMISNGPLFSSAVCLTSPLLSHSLACHRSIKNSPACAFDLYHNAAKRILERP